jgi:hypothetical protein
MDSCVHSRTFVGTVSINWSESDTAFVAPRFGTNDTKKSMRHAATLSDSAKIFFGKFTQKISAKKSEPKVSVPILLFICCGDVVNYLGLSPLCPCSLLHRLAPSFVVIHLHSCSPTRCFPLSHTQYLLLSLSLFPWLPSSLSLTFLLTLPLPVSFPFSHSHSIFTSHLFPPLSVSHSPTHTRSLSLAFSLSTTILFTGGAKAEDRVSASRTSRLDVPTTISANGTG